MTISQERTDSMRTKRFIALITALCICAALAGCGNSSNENSSAADSSDSVTESVSENSTSESAAEANEAVTDLSKIDMTKWQYNADDEVYYQVGISYCENPADTSYETLAIFVPAAYMTGTDNGDGTYTCELTSESVNGYTAETAPIVMPINTPGYSAMAALTDYDASLTGSSLNRCITIEASPSMDFRISTFAVEMYISDGLMTIMLLTADQNSCEPDFLALRKFVCAFKPIAQRTAFDSLLPTPHSPALSDSFELLDQLFPFFFAHLLSLLFTLVTYIIS